MSKTTMLEDARRYEQAPSNTIPAGERPGFHMTPRTGWTNDPNGFCFYGGQYHLFHQYYPYDTVWGPMHWGHVTSKDLLHWDYLPAALAPDTPADAAGCFSGSALPLEDGRLMLMYTGVQRPAAPGQPEPQAQCIALGDGQDFEKCAQNPVIGADLLPEGYSKTDFRDPKIWKEDGRYFCVVAGMHETDRGSILLYQSEDARTWRYAARLAASCGEYGGMWECPDFFPLEGTQVLLVSPVEMQPTPDLEYRPGHGTLALLGQYDAGTHHFVRQSAQAIDQGLDFYAPQTLLAPGGRRIMIAWMENWATCRTVPRPHRWFGSMTLPRELFVRDGRLCQRPVRELEQMWRTTLCRDVLLDGESRFDGVKGRMLDMTLVLDTGASPECRRFTLHLAEGEGLFTEVVCDLAHGELLLDRSQSGTVQDIPHSRRIRLLPRQGKLTMRVVMDTESIELFLNEGERAMTACISTPLRADGIRFMSDGPLRMHLEHHTLG